MQRFRQLVFVVSLLALSWFAMMAFHEVGHVVGAVITGGTVERVVLHPLTISRTDVSPNPNPSNRCLAGPNSWLYPACCLQLVGTSTINGRSKYRVVLHWFLLAGQRLVHRLWGV